MRLRRRFFIKALLKALATLFFLAASARIAIHSDVNVEFVKAKQSLSYRTSGNLPDKGTYITNVKKNWHATSPLVHSVTTFDSDTFVLFSNALFRETGTWHCTVNGKQIPGKRGSHNSFQCKIPRKVTIKNTDVLSLQSPSGYTLPSIAKWADRHGLTSLGYSNLSACIVAIVKDEERQIESFIEYHLRQGVQAIIVHDNNSSDNTVSKLRKYKHVIVFDWPWPHTQQEAYIHGNLYIREACKWSILIDADEYIYPAAMVPSLTVQSMFASFPQWIKNKTVWPESPEKVHQLCFDAKVMGTSGRIKWPNVSVPEAYINLHRFNPTGKCAVQPAKLILTPDVHHFKVKGTTFYFPRETAYMLHYHWQCWEFHIRKWEKGRASHNADWDVRKLNKSKPTGTWTEKPGPLDTEFRDYCRKVQKWPLPE